MRRTLFSAVLIMILLSATTSCGSKSKSGSSEKATREFLDFIKELNISNPAASKEAVPKVKQFFQEKFEKGAEVSEFDGLPFQIWPVIFAPMPNEEGYVKVPFTLASKYADKYNVTLNIEVRMKREEAAKLNTKQLFNVVPKYLFSADFMEVKILGSDIGKPNLWISNLIFLEAEVTPWEE